MVHRPVHWKAQILGGERENNLGHKVKKFGGKNSRIAKVHQMCCLSPFSMIRTTNNPGLTYNALSLIIFPDGLQVIVNAKS